MSHSNLKLGVALAVVLSAGAVLRATPVLAADLDASTADLDSSGGAALDPALEDPPKAMPNSPVSNVVFGSGWYVRGDAAVTDAFKVGIARVSRYGFEDSVGHTGSPAYDLSLGGGYAFTNHFRTDIIADFFQPSYATVNNQECAQALTRTTCELVGTFNHYDALLNGYYDIGTWSIVTPYVGVGVGVGFGSVQGTLYGDKTVDQGDVGYHNFAFAGMAGLAFDVYPHLKVDVGYRYVNNGRVGGTEISNQELRAGVRYMIDN